MAVTEVATSSYLTDSVAVVSPRREMTVAQAKAVLRMSERHLNDLLDAGEIEYRLVGNDRMIERDSLFAFEQEREQLRSALDVIVQDSQEMGLYDDIES